MSTSVNNTGDRGQNRITLPFIGKYLKASGLDAKRDRDAYYANLVQEKDLLIGLKKGTLTVAVALPVNEEEIENVSMLADITMASTMMTKVFLVPGEDGMSMWFAVETFCKTRRQFEEIFDPILNLLLKSVRTFIGIRDEVEEAKQVEAMTDYLMSRASGVRPC